MFNRPPTHGNPDSPQGIAVGDALVSIWSNVSIVREDAAAASAWILSHIDMSGTAPAPLGAGDPRADLMVGLHIGHLLLISLQMMPVVGKSERRASYVAWLWDEVIGQRLRMYPDLLPHIIETLERNLVDDPLDDLGQSRIWKAFCSEMINSLPLPLRMPLLARPEVRASFGISDRGLMTVGSFDFDAVEYLTAIIEIKDGETRKLTTTAGKKATLRLVEKDGEAVVAITIKRRRQDVDDWARRLCSDDPSTRRAALQDQASALDMAPEEIEQLAHDLGNLPQVERVLKTVRLTGDSMAGWYGQFGAHLRTRAPVGVGDILPADLSPAFRHLQLDRASTLEEAQRLTIVAVGLHEAIRRWSPVPVTPGPAFFEAVVVLDDDVLIQMADDLSNGHGAWTKLFVARLMWARSVSSERLRDILRDGVVAAVTSDTADEEWRTFTACARLVAGEASQKAGWAERSMMQRLAMAWAHAGTLTHQMLQAGLNAAGLADFLNRARLATPRNLLGDPTGLNGDTANPLDVLYHRLKIHAAAPLVAEMAADERDAETVHIVTVGLLMDVRDGVPTPSIQVSHGALTLGNALGSYLGDSVCPFLDPIVKTEISFLAPRLTAFLKEMIDSNDQVIQRNGWIRLRSASGHGCLPDVLARHARRAADDLVILTDSGNAGTDLVVLLALTSIAAENGWTDLCPRIDDASDHLRDGEADLGDETLPHLFEVAFHRAMMETDLEERTRNLAAAIERLATNARLRPAAIDISERFAMAMPGSFATPFVDALARFRAV